MSVRSHDDATEYDSLGVDARELLRYAAITLQDGEVLLYDQKEEDAWIQTDTAVGIETMA